MKLIPSISLLSDIFFLWIIEVTRCKIKSKILEIHQRLGRLFNCFLKISKYKWKRWYFTGHGEEVIWKAEDFWLELWCWKSERENFPLFILFFLSFVGTKSTKKPNLTFRQLVIILQASLSATSILVACAEWLQTGHASSPTE